MLVKPMLVTPIVIEPLSDRCRRVFPILRNADTVVAKRKRITLASRRELHE